MPMHADAATLRLAIIAMAAAASDEPDDRTACADLMDRAGEIAIAAPPALLSAVEADDPEAARLDAVRTIASLCALCARCPRGRQAVNAADPLARSVI